MAPDYFAEAMGRFVALFERAKSSGLKEPGAVTLATADERGRPSARTVLLKHFDERGFVFYTNLFSRKASDLLVNPRAALCFYWETLGEQVVVEGEAERVSGGEADAWWASRPRMSQAGGWASRQSKPLSHRGVLELRAAVYAARFTGREIPRPPHSSGFRIAPDRIEFWKIRPFRLHERMLYERRGGIWTRSLVYP